MFHLLNGLSLRLKVCSLSFWSLFYVFFSGDLNAGRGILIVKVYPIVECCLIWMASEKQTTFVLAASKTSETSSYWSGIILPFKNLTIQTGIQIVRASEYLTWISPLIRFLQYSGIQILTYVLFILFVTEMFFFKCPRF